MHDHGSGHRGHAPSRLARDARGPDLLDPITPQREFVDGHSF